MSVKARVAKRAEYIEMRPGASWSVDGELWIFEAGGQIAIGPETSLDGDPQTVTAQLASEMIRAGKAEAVSVIEIEREGFAFQALERQDLEREDLEREDLEREDLEREGLELVRLDAEEAA